MHSIPEGTKLLTVTVNPTPHLTNSAPPPICSEAIFNAPLLCDVTGGDFTWTATSNPAGAVTGFTANQTTGVTLISEALTNTTVKNGPSVAGLGLGGEGYLSYSIATTTGEGITTPKTFTRIRRCVLVENLRII
jgi:hypothetical protein